MNSTRKYVFAFFGLAAIGATLANATPALQRLKQLFSSGTAASPAVAFQSDSDTGFYSAAANTFGIAGGGAAAMTVTPGTLTMSKSTTTNSLVSSTSATAMTSSVAAWTLSPSATPAANDLVLEVNDDQGASLFSVDVEGDVVFAGTLTCSSSVVDLTLSGNDMTASGTGQSFNIVSATNDATTSSTVAAITLSTSTNVTAGDLVLEVNDSAAASLLSVTEQGDVYQLGRSISTSTLTVADSGDGSAAAGTVTPSADVVVVTCSDSDGCTMTMSETGAITGSRITITNTSANTATFADSAGVSEIAGSFAAGQYDTITLVYAGSTWIEVSRSNN
jgi:hypothetical protein